MPQRSLVSSRLHHEAILSVTSDAPQLWLGGVAFNESELCAMTSVVDDVCAQYESWNTPEQREFIAWLVIRLSRNGIGDGTQVKKAVIGSLLPSERLPA